jgi:sec-independent protein translocase protein TatA
MSGMEIIVILFVYLLLFGAKGVPALAQTLGKAVFQFRNATRDVQNEILKSSNEIRKQADIKLDQIDQPAISRTPPKPESIPAEGSIPSDIPDSEVK